MSDDWKTRAEQAWNAPSRREAAQQHSERTSGRQRESTESVRARRLLDDSVSLERAWREIDDARNRSTPESTVDALVYCVRQRGLAALEEPENVGRLRRCDAGAKAQFNSRIAKLGDLR
jgi:hypothetical protein